MRYLANVAGMRAVKLEFDSSGSKVVVRGAGNQGDTGTRVGEIEKCSATLHVILLLI